MSAESREFEEELSTGDIIVPATDPLTALQDQVASLEGQVARQQQDMHELRESFQKLWSTYQIVAHELRVRRNR